MSFPASKSKLNKLRKARGSRKVKAFKPQLTSLVDVMTILLIYLLQSFSTEGEIFTISKELILPESSAQKRPELNVVIAVNNRFIVAEGENLANVDQVMASDELVIPALSDWLEKRREMTTKIEQYSTTTKFTGNVTIQGDKRIRFDLLKKIMYTCGRQQYNNFSLAVQRKEG